MPALLDSLREHRLRASFFFSVGPDNMGRHLWRLLRPSFLAKMLRSDAAGLYGWDILLRGTLWPGPRIAKRLGHVMRRAADEGHEVGLHAWDHHEWQAKVDRMDSTAIRMSLRRGIEALTVAVGRPPTCSAAAGWKCDERVLIEQQDLGLEYHSDCRGTALFRPVVDGVPLAPQVPVTLPTYDEWIGRDGVTDENYNARLLEELTDVGVDVLTIHAEVEGIAKHELWRDFLKCALERGVEFCPLGDLVREATHLPFARIEQAELEGREGLLCVQGAVVEL